MTAFGELPPNIRGRGERQLTSGSALEKKAARSRAWRADAFFLRSLTDRWAATLCSPHAWKRLLRASFSMLPEAAMQT